MTNKEPELIAALDYIQSLVGDRAIVAADRWAADRTAIGVEHPDRPGMLAYIALRNPGQFDVMFEHPPALGSDLPYQPAGGAEALSLQSLSVTVAKFLLGGCT